MGKNPFSYILTSKIRQGKAARLGVQLGHEVLWCPSTSLHPLCCRHLLRNECQNHRFKAHFALRISPYKSITSMSAVLCGLKFGI